MQRDPPTAAIPTRMPSAGHMFIKEPCKETDAHPWNDADESIIERIVLQGKLQKQTWRPQGLDEGEETEQESHQRSYLRSCHQAPIMVGI